MRLLVVTQTVDQNDSNLGFFHVWLQKLATRVKHLYVICLEAGEHHLPINVTVISLGKEKRRVPSLTYAWRFHRALCKITGQYDGVFVHMNPEYLILAGWYWRITGKKVLLWYVHKAVNFRLWLAEKFVTKIFTASKESFRLKSKNVEVTGHGIDVDSFVKSNEANIDQGELWCLAVGRVAPAKDLETVIKALGELRRRKVMIHLSIVGSPALHRDYEYKKKIETMAARVLLPDGRPAISFRSQRHYEQMPGVYHHHHILIHTSKTGSIDKVVLEALASGRPVISSSEAFAQLANKELKGSLYHFQPGDYQELAKTIENIYESGILKTIPIQPGISYVRQNHNLDNLVGRIISYFESD